MAGEQHAQEQGRTVDLSRLLSRLLDAFHKEWLVLLLLFLFPLALHILFKNAGLYHFDTAFDVWAIEETVKTGKLTYSYGWGAPGNVVLTSGMYLVDRLIRGDVSAEFVYFLQNFIAAALASVVVYLIVNKLTKDRFMAIASSLLLSVTPIWLSTTTYPKTHAITELAALLAVWFVLKAIDEPRQVWLLLSGFFLGFSISIRPFSIFYLLPLLVFYISGTVSLKEGKLALSKQHWHPLKLASFAAPMVLVPFLLLLPMILARGGMDGWLASLANEQRGGWQGILSQQTPIALSYITRSIGILGWIAALGGAVWLGIRKQWAFLLALLLWGGSFFFYLGNLLPTEARFLNSTMIPVCVMMASGCTLLYHQQAKKKLWGKPVGIILLALLMITTFSVIYPVIKARHDYSGSRGFAEFVGANTESNARIIIGDQHIFIKHYAKRQDFVAPDEVRGAARVQLMVETVKSGTPLYLAESGIAFLTPEERQAIQDNFNIVVVGSAKNEVYQFSEFDLKPYEERLMKLVIKDPSPAQGTS